jgi:hypothetical protein
MRQNSAHDARPALATELDDAAFGGAGAGQRQEVVAGAEAAFGLKKISGWPAAAKAPREASPNRPQKTVSTTQPQ